MIHLISTKKHLFILAVALFGTLYVSAENTRFQEYLLAAQNAAQSDQAESAEILLIAALEINPESNQAQTLLKSTQERVSSRKLEEGALRIALLRSALESHQRGWLYATQLLLLNLQSSDPHNTNVHGLLESINAKLAERKNHPPSPPKQAFAQQKRQQITTSQTRSPGSPNTNSSRAKRSTRSSTIQAHANYKPTRAISPTQPQQKHMAQTAAPHKPSDLQPHEGNYIVPAIKNSRLEAAEIRIIQEWRDALTIDQVVERGPKSIMKIGDKAYRIGEAVLPELYLYWHDLNASKNVVYFIDRRGHLFSKSYGK